MKTSVFRLPLASSALLSAVFASSVGAQEAARAADEDIQLGAITVTSTGLPTEVKYSPSSVTVLEEGDIREIPPSSVANLLKGVPGVRVSESGIERIRIRGEASQRVAILIDGQRISDHTTYGTPILIAPTEIERIEVVRGPSSVVSGNRAIGGVVNIITKRGADKPVEVTVSGGYLGANEGYRASTSVAGTLGNFDYRLGLSQSDLGNRQTPEGELDPSGSEDRDLNAFIGYRMGNHYIGLRAQDYDLAADVYTGIPNFSIELPKRDLRKYSTFYEGENLTPWMSMLKVSAYTQEIERQFRNSSNFGGPSTSTSDDVQDTYGLQASANFEFAPGHRTVVGFEYENDSMFSNKVSTSTRGTTTRVSDASIETFSAFAQHEMELSSALTGTFGLRYYNVDAALDSYLVNGAAQTLSQNKDDRFLGSAGLVYELHNGAVLRGSISQGYTYPSLSQLFLTSVGAGGTVIGNPDLKPETATNYELGARIDQGNLVLDAAVFYTDSDDYITSVTVAPRTSVYQNVNKARSYGFELAAELDPGWANGIRPYANIAYVTRKFTYSNGYTTADSGTPKWSGDLGVRGDWALANLGGTWDAFLRGESSATQRSSSGAVADETAGWGTVNLRGTVDLTETVSMSVELGNLFDKSYRSIGQIDGAGRNASVFLTAKF
ncbi:TonB-dependent receptor plug domain-containing protein [Shimia marina]|uniref:Colicin I receptor n=1 Tax=Shimia marina TaxID=321267 RepID=A0A0P1EPK8_9RHOB|nr:TonB-dependent receptor [Shimia marina]CUH52019.1 Colicin I receptor precursor [Shimia marina]SFE62005.1 hemoglobin/transferrin/lactoferrin receptor protein [Shimia marina]